MWGDRRITSHGSCDGSADLVKSARKQMLGDCRGASLQPGSLCNCRETRALVCRHAAAPSLVRTPLRSGLALGPTGRRGSLPFIENRRRLLLSQTESEYLQLPPLVHLVFAGFRNGNYSPKPRVSGCGCPIPPGSPLKAACPGSLVMGLVLFPPPQPHHAPNEQHPTQILWA